jgi:hypothetical protein
MGLMTAGLLTTAALSAGCNPLELGYFLFGPEPKIEASLKQIASTDKERTVRAVVLVSNDANSSMDFVRADVELSHLVVNKMRDQCKYNNEKVELISPTKVNEFKNKHPDWRTIPPEKIGTHFDADYVIDLEINKLSLYEYGSANQIYRGRAEISITLFDVNNPDEGAERSEFNYVYPSDSIQGVPIDDKPKEKFIEDFYKSLAEKITWHFTAHPTREAFSFRGE